MSRGKKRIKKRIKKRMKKECWSLPYIFGSRDYAG